VRLALHPARTINQRFKTSITCVYRRYSCPNGLEATGLEETTKNSQIDILKYSIRALKDMPGRKILINITPSVTMLAVSLNYYNRLADKALRAGAVINYMDTRGLYNYFTDAAIIPNNTTVIALPFPLGNH
jgi:hypothetical protein